MNPLAEVTVPSGISSSVKANPLAGGMDVLGYEGNGDGGGPGGSGAVIARGCAVVVAVV
jgi:hypothetical protein